MSALTGNNTSPEDGAIFIIRELNDCFTTVFEPFFTEKIKILLAIPALFFIGYIGTPYSVSYAKTLSDHFLGDGMFSFCNDGSACGRS